MTMTGSNSANYDAIVIGGGIGGLAFSAVACGQLGKKVLLIEKNSAVGGRLFSFQREGFTLDIGAHVISQSEKGPLGRVLRAVKKDGEINWKHVRPMTSFRGDIFAFPKGLEGRISAEQYATLTALMKEMVWMEEAATRELDDISVYDYVTGKGLRDPLALACINNVTMVYVCVPDYQASAGEFIRCLGNEARSRASGYPVGGCSAVSEALAQGITAAGGEILTRSAVDQIIVEGGRAVGVRVGEQTFRAPLIVSNADGRCTLLDLLPAGTLSDAEHRRVKDMVYSYSMLIVRLALDHPVTDHRLVTHIANFDPRRNEEDLLAGRFPEEINLFMPVPSNFSPECAPEGKQLLTIGVFAPYKTPDTDRLADIAVKTAEKIFPGLKEAIMWRHMTTPEQLHGAVGENGAIIGLAQSVGQVGKHRLKVETSVPGLYLCGAESGGSGVGIELSSNCAFELLTKLGEKDPAWKMAAE